MSVLSAQGGRYMRTDTTTYLSEPSTRSRAPSSARTPPVVQYQEYQEQRASQDVPHEPRGTGGRPAVVPSGSSRGPVASGNRRAPVDRYPCDICGKSYAQTQGLKRHQREKHDASFCTYCDVFAWGRPYRLREHLEERHPDVDVNAALEEATRVHRKTTGLASSRGD